MELLTAINNRSRRAFLKKSLVGFLLTFPFIVHPRNKHTPNETFLRKKFFLTQDGELVEVRVRDIPQKKKWLSTAQIKRWIWKKQPEDIN